MHSRLLRWHGPPHDRVLLEPPRPLGKRPSRARPVLAYKIIIAALAAIAAALFVVTTAKLLIVLFAGILFALVLSKIAAALSRRTHLDYRASVVIVVLGWLGATAAALVFLGPQVAHQVSLLVEALPAASKEVLDHLHRSRLGPAIPETPTPSHLVPPTKVVTAIASFMGGSIDVLVGLVVIFFFGIYGAAQPGVYVEGVVRLTPGRYRSRVARVVAAVSSTLTRWLLGRLVAMAFVGVTTAIAFELLHVPLALTLALLAGLLTFIAYLGAVVSAIPPILLAFTVSPATAGWVLLLFTAIHVVEGYLLTPLIARAAVHFPPLVTLAGQVILGSLLGVLGLTFSTPLLVVAVVAVKTWRSETRPP